MPKRIELDGEIHEFPDDFTDEDIAAALGGGLQTAAPDSPAPGMLSEFVGGVGDVIKGTYNTLRHPLDTGKQMIENINQAVAPDALEQITNRPRQSLGRNVGQAAGIIGMGKLPAVVKPAARGLGSVASTAGETLQKHPMAVNLAAAHQFMSGNIPGAMGLVVAPDILPKVGSALARYGEAPGGPLKGAGPLSSTAGDAAIIAEVLQKYPGVDPSKIRVSPKVGGGWDKPPVAPSPKAASGMSANKASLMEPPDPAFESMMDSAAGEAGGIPRLNPQGYGTMGGNEPAFSKAHFSAPEVLEGQKMIASGMSQADAVKRLLLLQELSKSSSFGQLK